MSRTRPFSFDLPPEARTRQTSFRWWQPDPLTMDSAAALQELEEALYPGTAPQNNNNIANNRAEWHLGNVILSANETLPYSLSSNEDKYNPLKTSETWFWIRGGEEISNSCHVTNETLLTFGENEGIPCKIFDFISRTIL